MAGVVAVPETIGTEGHSNGFAARMTPVGNITRRPSYSAVALNTILGQLFQPLVNVYQWTGKKKPNPIQLVERSKHNLWAEDGVELERKLQILAIHGAAGALILGVGCGLVDVYDVGIA